MEEFVGMFDVSGVCGEGVVENVTVGFVSMDVGSVVGMIIVEYGMPDKVSSSKMSLMDV